MEKTTATPEPGDQEHAPPTRSSTGAAASPPPSGGVPAGVFALTILLAGAAVAGSILYGDQIRARFLPPGELQVRVGTLEKTIGTAAGGTDAGTKPLAERVASLEQAVAGIDRRIADAVAPGNRVAGILAIRQLRTALNGSGPFDGELALMRLSGTADTSLAKALDQISPKAAQGILSRSDLAARYAVLVPSLLQADLSGSTAGISDTMWNWVSGISGVFGSAPPEEVTPENRTATTLARAALALEDGDLAIAVDRLAQLEGLPRDTVAPWLADARARLAAEQAVAALDGLLATLMGS
ncbi:hypothetical protein M2352_005045 [Azospirillum fermentarium]|uniref:mitofilin family membrane protein n=1 Tax=Azospirillum fermentarium TaxID=1233114 RepID=UPI002227A40C|nr:mitofilin family membrane protein [Azospirillum fermentarium]MCW2249385.1 hypothetical protein [Azospirillum fermentarium]